MRHLTKAYGCERIRLARSKLPELGVLGDINMLHHFQGVKKVHGNKLAMQELRIQIKGPRGALLAGIKNSKLH